MTVPAADATPASFTFTPPPPNSPMTFPTTTLPAPPLMITPAPPVFQIVLLATTELSVEPSWKTKTKNRVNL